jgi:hypothetical protein
MVEVSAPWDVARHRLAFGYRRFGTTSVASTSVKQSKKFLGSRTLVVGTDMSQNVRNRLQTYTAQYDRRAKAFISLHRCEGFSSSGNILSETFLILGRTKNVHWSFM